MTSVIDILLCTVGSAISGLLVQFQCLFLMRKRELVKNSAGFFIMSVLRASLGAKINSVLAPEMKLTEEMSMTDSSTRLEYDKIIGQHTDGLVAFREYEVCCNCNPM